MKTIVIYKSKYGYTKVYAQWIAEQLKDIKTFYLNCISINNFFFMLVG